MRRTCNDQFAEAGWIMEYLETAPIKNSHGACGNIHPNSKFPDTKPLGNDVHSKGLKFGIYSSPGPKTCGGYEGSYVHEQQDADTYASWGVDFLKYDLCSYMDTMKLHDPH